MALAIQENVPLAPLTTFKIGGSARYFAEVRNKEEIQDVLTFARTRGLRFVILGGGSNVLVPDDGIDGLVVRIISDAFSFSGTELAADAGCVLRSLIRAAGEKGLGGWEKLAGIPGTLGGAVRGNAGAFGPEIKDFIASVQTFDTDSGIVRDVPHSSCEFAYRTSYFKRHPELVILGATFVLRTVDPNASSQLQKDTVAEREKRHIQNVQAAGSFFVNPTVSHDIQKLFETEKGSLSREGRVPAGWLIEKAGLRGARVGGAVASEQHPNYLKNDGGASAHDVKNLAQRIKLEIYNQFGVELKEEAVLL